MKVYIATKFENKDGFNQLRQKLEAAGHSITHDWTKEGEEKAPEGKLDEYLCGCACKDYMGVAGADALILIPVAEPMAGAWVEMGIALYAHKRVIYIDNGLKRNIFYHLPNVLPARDMDHAVELLSV